MTKTQLDFYLFVRIIQNLNPDQIIDCLYLLKNNYFFKCK